jgi:hypothetical protein
MMLLSWALEEQLQLESNPKEKLRAEQGREFEPNPSSTPDPKPSKCEKLIEKKRQTIAAVF